MTASSKDLASLIGFTESCVGGAVVGVPQRLTGGVASEVFGLTCVVGGMKRRVVARRYLKGPPTKHVRPTIERETSTLLQLEALKFTAPRLLGADPSGDVAGCPALVMTMLPGRLSLRPEDPEGWTSALAHRLVDVHALALDAPPYSFSFDPPFVEPPTWTRRPDLWRAAIELLATPPPAEPTGAVHGDYQQFNILWHKASISGVIDWTTSSIGPPDADVAHARLNLVCLYGVERAEDFRRSYEARAGRATSAWRDVVEFACYRPAFGGTLRRQIARRMALEMAGMNERVEELLRLALDRA
jgi:aminoglycoside phosphotransferase (APT) family kinase protein